MALISIIEDFHPLLDSRLLERAEELTPVLYHEVHGITGVFRWQGKGLEEEIPPEDLSRLTLGKGERICLDFGDHMVGYSTLDLSFSGSHPDAPATLKLRFAENLRELYEDADRYDGWLSRSWIQEEVIHVDLLPAKVKLERRYAFRYLLIEVVDTSPKYTLRVRNAECLTESSANCENLPAFHTGDELLDRIYCVSLKTLADCMQEVLEDGPKRDRRLWTGDMRLQALTNAVSFRNFELIKRCLYLFGGSRFPDGRVSACIFTKPTPEADDTYLLDYALMYTIALEEYLQETGDKEALEDLYEIAIEQVDAVLMKCTDDDLVSPEAVKDAFIDWGDELDKTACTQGVLIYALRYAEKLALRNHDESLAAGYAERREALQKAARKAFWSEEAGCFLSNGQASVSTQVWMVLAGVPTPDQAKRAMCYAMEDRGGVRMQTPYMHHYYVMALLQCGMKEEAKAHLKAYWGGMLEEGADTFWECWDGKDPNLSPYGGSIVNSFCHAWSCTPAYIMARYL